MQFIQRIRLFFYNFFLRRRLKAYQIKRQIVAFEHATSIGILFPTQISGNTSFISEYEKMLSKKQKKITTLAYLNKKEKDVNFPFQHFSNKEINWAFCPKGAAVTTFMQQPFDILITIATESSIILEYISTLSKANLRVGPYTENTYAYDLMIDVADKNNIKKFIQEVELLLTKTRTTHEQSTT